MPGPLITYHRFGEVIVLRFNGGPEDARRIGALLKDVGDDWHGFMAIAPEDFSKDPESEEMIRACLARAQAGFRGWWDMSPPTLTRFDCYYCEATSIEEDGEWITYECGTVCHFPETEADKKDGRRPRVVAPCPEFLAETIKDLVTKHCYKPVGDHVDPERPKGEASLDPIRESAQLMRDAHTTPTPPDLDDGG